METNIPYADNLLAYIEQRIDETEKSKRQAFANSEYLWMKGYIQCLKDYNVRDDEYCHSLRIKLSEIVHDYIEGDNELRSDYERT